VLLVPIASCSLPVARDAPEAGRILPPTTAGVGAEDSPTSRPPGVPPAPDPRRAGSLARPAHETGPAAV